jgi:hypothetical protein
MTARLSRIAEVADAGTTSAKDGDGGTPPAEGGGADLADRLLHAPIPDDDRPGRRWAYSLWLMILMSLAIGYHSTVLLVHALPGKGLTKGLQTFINEKLQASNYMRAMGISQSWAMFAPNPHRSNLFMRVLVKDKDGEIWDLAHDMYGHREYPYLFYSRMGKINRRIIDEKGYRRHYAAWVCRDWEMTHDGEAPEEVQFIKMWTQVLPPEKAFRTMGYDPMKLYLNQREEDAIRCATTYHAQVPDDIRARLGMEPLPSPTKFRDVNVRTWWDQQRQKERQAEREKKAAADDDEDVELAEPVNEVEGGQ